MPLWALCHMSNLRNGNVVLSILGNKGHIIPTGSTSRTRQLSRQVQVGYACMRECAVECVSMCVEWHSQWVSVGGEAAGGSQDAWAVNPLNCWTWSSFFSLDLWPQNCVSVSGQRYTVWFPVKIHSCSESTNRPQLPVSVREGKSLVYNYQGVIVSQLFF